MRRREVRLACTQIQRVEMPADAVAATGFRWAQFKLRVQQLHRKVQDEGINRARAAPVVWGKEPMVVVGNGGIAICLGRRASKPSLRVNSASSSSSDAPPEHAASVLGLKSIGPEPRLRASQTGPCRSSILKSQPCGCRLCLGPKP